MLHSSFGTLALLVLLIAAIALALTPHERHSTASLPGPLWSSR